MYRHMMQVVCVMALSILSGIGVAQAVSLGKIDVASHLGEPFYAEIPLGLDNGESIANVFVSLATDSDYRLLEVFHDRSIDVIKVNIKRDQRGSRVELSSVRPLELPFFNLIMKVKQGRATHFKKISVFLDLPKSSAQTREKSASKPVIQKAATLPTSLPRATKMLKTEQHKPVSKKQASWARTQRYGPMVFGDTITTVAQRLRVDQRFTTQQVMLALFEKNKNKFGKKNINLIKAGKYLDVPTADEVMEHSDVEAVRILHQHAIAWKKLTQQHQYARLKEAQKNRYARHVSMGENATGVATLGAEDHAKSNDAHVMPVHKSGFESTTVSLLQKENSDLKKRLNDLESALSKMASQPSNEEALAASIATVKKLEIQLARQNGALQKARQKMLKQQGDEGDVGLLTWVLIAVVTLLSILIGYLVYTLKGNRQHPSKQEKVTHVNDSVDNDEFDAPMVDGSDRDALPSAAELEAIPDLTDEDTSEMEAFQDLEEEPDPNIDYLSEADVYTRYGMDDEAEKQINMALRLREDNKDAHIKRVEIRQARGDQAGVKEALEAGKLVLAGASLTAFMSAYEALGSDGGVVATESVEVEPLIPNNTGIDLEEFNLPDLSNHDIDELDLSESEVSSNDDGLNFPSLELPSIMNDDADMEETALIDISDDLNLDDISLDDFNASDNGELLSPVSDSDAMANDMDISSFELPKNDDTGIEAPAMIDMSDGLNLDDISDDLNLDGSELLSPASDSDEITTDMDLSSFELANDDTVLADISDDLNLDDSELLSPASDLDEITTDVDLPSFELPDDDTSIEATSKTNEPDDTDVEATAMFDISDDLNLDGSELLSPASDLDEITTDMDLSSFELPDDDTSIEATSKTNEPDDTDVEATAMFDISDDLNLDGSELLSPASDLDEITTDMDLSSFELPDDDTSIEATSKTNEPDDTDVEATAMFDISDDLNLDDSELLSPASDLDEITTDVDLPSFELANDDTVLADISDDLNLDGSELLSSVSDLNETNNNDEANATGLRADMDALDNLDLSITESVNAISSPDLDELDLDELDIDLDIENHDVNLEGFTSTIQATLKELGVDDSDLDEDIKNLNGADDLHLNDSEEEKMKSDFDASLELDNLLSELDDFIAKK